MSSSGLPVLQGMKKHICSEKFMPCKFHPKGSNFEPDAKNLKSYIREIDIDSQWTDNQGSGIIVSNEAYSLDLSNDGPSRLFLPRVGCTQLYTITAGLRTF